MWLRSSERSPARRTGRSVSPDDVDTVHWAAYDDPPLPVVDDDDATGSQVDWDEDGRPVFTVFFESGTSKRYVDDETAWRAVDVFGVSRPPARQLH